MMWFLLLFVVLPAGAMIWGALEAGKRCESYGDKLDRRAMYNAVMQQSRIHDEVEVALCGDDREKLNAWFLDADCSRAKRNAEILARAKEVFRIK